MRIYKWFTIFVAVLGAFAINGRADTDVSPASENPIYDIVAVGLGPEGIVLATPAKPFSDLRWRFRSIPLATGGPRVKAVTLSRGGTKALVVFNDGGEQILDLTEKLVSLEAEKIQAPRHHLPGQYFPVSRADRICLMDDMGRVLGPSCKVAAGAVVHEDGRVLYILADGSLSVYPPEGAEDDPLPFRLLPANRYQLLAGRKGEPNDFLVLIQQNKKVEVVDPTRAAGQLGIYDSWELASLHALLQFGSRTRGHEITDQTLRELVLNLDRQSKPKTYEWSFFRLRPEVPLYAPVLEFAPEEPVFTSDVQIWNALNPITRGTTREAYREAYDSLGRDRLQRCTAYYREYSYPGSWLIEYWYYYPFDEGKPLPHIHDSEHLFVEVDKLGGAVRSVLASAHNPSTPNNNYSTFVPGARPVELPLFAFAEFEKHAMCPDINRDGLFTNGIDVNLYPRWFEVWGLRDLGAKKGHFMEPYRPSMSLPRKEEDRFALQDYSDYFPGLEVPPEKATCQLVPFIEGPRCKDCAIGTVAAAESHLVAHTDAQKPENIYKPWVLPWYQFRVGLGLSEHEGNWDQLYGAFVADLNHLTRGRFPVPGRLALEAMWSPSSQFHTSNSGGQSLTIRLSSETYVGARYEQLLTNTQGFYFGVDPLFHKFNIARVNGQPVSSTASWQYEGAWVRVGYLLELPTRRFGNMAHYVGVSFPNFHTVRFEWRVGLGLLRRRGRHDFGIRSDDPNPYQ